MSASDIYWRIKQAIARKIALARLAEIDDKVYIQMSADQVGGWKDGQTVDIADYPATFITSEGLSEQEAGEYTDSEADGFGYPSRIFLADRVDDRDFKREPFITGWRKEITQLFRRGLSEVPEVCEVTFDYDIIIDNTQPGYQYLVSGLVLWAWTQETRV